MKPLGHIFGALARIARAAQQLQVGQFVRAAHRDCFDMVDFETLGRSAGDTFTTAALEYYGNVSPAQSADEKPFLGSSIGLASSPDFTGTLWVSFGPSFYRISGFLRVLIAVSALKFIQTLFVCRQPRLAGLAGLVAWVLLSPSPIMGADFIRISLAPFVSSDQLPSLALWAAFVAIISCFYLVRIGLRPFYGEPIPMGGVIGVCSAAILNVRAVLNSGALAAASICYVALDYMSSSALDARKEPRKAHRLRITTADNLGHPSYLQKGSLLSC